MAVAVLSALFGAKPHALRDDLRIPGQRVYLRPRQGCDDVALYQYASDLEVVRFLPWEVAPSVEAVKPFLAETMERRRHGESLDLAIVLRETDEVIGQTDLMDLRSPLPRGQAELGYILARPYWGQGLMTEAASLTVGYGFGLLRLGKIIAYADEENVASQRVMQKLGMRLCGRETRTVKGEDREYVRYEITKAEWLGR